MNDTMPTKSSRRFTKILVWANMLLVWPLIFYSVYAGQAEWIATPAFALIGAIFGFYTGVGHLDYRSAINLSVDKLLKKNGGENEG